MPFRAIRDKQGKPTIIFLDEPDEYEPEEQEEEQEPDTSFVSSSTTAATTTNPPKENTDTLSPMYEPPVKGESFFEAHPREVRSIYSMPHPKEESDLEVLNPSSPESQNAKWIRENRITSYKEHVWPVQNSANVLNSQERAEALHLEKRRNDMRRLNARYYMQQTGREEHEQY